MSAPLVSVCVPVYNAEPYLEETLRSVLAQSYQHWELVIVENQSTDGSRALIERLVNETADARLRVHLNDTHLDMASNMNRSLELARGEFVKILCADDTMEPDCLAVQVRALEEHPGAVMAACARRIINAQGRLLFHRRTFRREGLISGRSAIQGCLHAGTNLVGEPTMVLLRASALQGVPWLDAAAAYCVDLELWLRLLLRGDLVYTRLPLASFRVHGQASTRDNEARMLADFFGMVEGIARQGNLSLSPLRLRWLKFQIPLQNAVRRWIYRWLG
jgi:glycosyltransferase involved in cell wall biosynthesis